jgi:branched-chain amino acid transport system substrate-binding protein
MERAIMRFLKYQIVLVGVLLVSGRTGFGKNLVAGVALRFDDKFNGTVSLFKDGIECAKDLFEKQHKGTKIKLVHFSHSPELSSVVAAADKIIQSKIPAVVGAEMSDEAMVLGDRLGPHKIPLVSHTASSPQVTENKPFSFRVCFSDAQVGDLMAKYVIEKLKPKTIGVLHNISYAYSDYLSKRFVAAVGKETSVLNPNERPSIFMQKVLSRSQDFSEQIAFFKSHKVTHLAMFTVDSDFMRFVTQAEKSQFFPVFIGSDGWGTNGYVYQRYVKDSPSGEKFVAFRNSYWKEDAKSEMANLFREAFKKQFHETPNAWNAIGFDAAWVLFTESKGPWFRYSDSTGIEEVAGNPNRHGQRAVLRSG